MSALRKVHWNVHTRCNLSCRFCYLWRRPTAIPLDTGRARQLVKEAARLSDWFVFGGGDPLMREDILDLVELAHCEGLNVDVQTNAVLLNTFTADRLMPFLSRLGLSLDGQDASVHGAMRGAATNFADVLNALQLADYYGLPTTIRTLVTKVNFGGLAGLASTIGQFRCVKKWSLREFAPLGRGEHTRTLYSLTREQFLEECHTIRQRLTGHSNIFLEVLTTEEMAHCYCLISEDGCVYGHPTCGPYRTYGRFPEESLASIICRLQQDASMHSHRLGLGSSLPFRIAPTS